MICADICRLHNNKDRGKLDCFFNFLMLFQFGELTVRLLDVDVISSFI